MFSVFINLALKINWHQYFGAFLAIIASVKYQIRNWNAHCHKIQSDSHLNGARSREIGILSLHMLHCIVTAALWFKSKFIWPGHATSLLRSNEKFAENVMTFLFTSAFTITSTHINYFDAKQISLLDFCFVQYWFCPISGIFP